MNLSTFAFIITGVLLNAFAQLLLKAGTNNLGEIHVTMDNWFATGIKVATQLPILAGHVLMGTDAPKSMGFTLTSGNTVTINLEPDTRAETDKLFAALGAGGQIDMPLQAMFWGGYFGILVDKYGIRWMFNCSSQA